VTDSPPGRALASATSLNPSAGHHVVTGDPREIAASERAGDRSWQAWTYYAHRYGERGRQLTRSDSGWITTLGSYPASVVKQQIDWLAALLAARGMPRLLMEDHLHILHEELVAAVPERAAEYAVLAQVAEGLRAERDASLPDSALRALDAAFREQVGDSVEDDLHAGALIGAAVADKQSGVARAVESLMEWLADPERFSAAWVAAVDGTLREARRGVASRSITPDGQTGVGQ
jgi:hypothetical protein